MPPTPSFDSVKFISLNREDLLARLRAIAAHIKSAESQVIEVRLFGSLARGDYTGLSDVDVLIVLNDSDETDPLHRILTFLPYFDLDRGTDLLVYTRAELEQLSATNPFLRRIWRESIPL